MNEVSGLCELEKVGVTIGRGREREGARERVSESERERVSEKERDRK